MVLKLNGLTKSLSRKKSKGRHNEGKPQYAVSGQGGAGTSADKSNAGRNSEIQVAARGPEPTVTFRYINGVRIALDPEHQDEPVILAHQGGPQLVSSPSSTESGGNPEGSDSDGAQVSSVANVAVSRPLQTIVESGASAWEVQTLWILKKCAWYKDSVSLTVMRISASKALMVCMAFAIIGFLGFRAWQGPQRKVDVFLRGIGLGQYFANFLENRYTMLEDVINITDEAELEEIGVSFKAERQRILRHAAALRTHQSVVLAVLWGVFCAGCVSLAVLVGCILVSPGARNRVACCLLWCGFMAWYKIRLWYRLWNTIDIECKPRLECAPTAPPMTPNSTLNPPSETSAASSPPVITRPNLGSR